MSDYRYQIVGHNGIPSLKVMIDAGELLSQYESPDCDGVLTTHIPIDDIEASIKRYRKEQTTVGKKQQKYVMTGKMKDGSSAPSGGVVKTDKNGHAVKKPAPTTKKGN